MANVENKAGRPPKFKNALELQKKINAYFCDCPDKKKFITKIGEVVEIPMPTICGLCYFLGFESRQSFYDYEENQEFSYTIKRARLFIEKEYEQLLQGTACTGAIFALKNMGWLDKTSQEITGSFIQKTTLEDIRNLKKMLDE